MLNHPRRSSGPGAFGEGEGKVSAVYPGEGMVFSYNIVCALLSACSQIAVDQVVGSQTLVFRESRTFESCQRETWTSNHVDPFGSQTRRRAYRIVVCELDVRGLQTPVVSALVGDHSQHLGHGVVHPSNASVPVWMIGACGKFVHRTPQKTEKQLVKAWRRTGGSLS